MRLRTAAAFIIFVFMAIVIGVEYYGTGYRLYLKEDSKQSAERIRGLFPNTCECQSMFTIGKCGSDNIGSFINDWKYLKQKLDFLHKGKNIAANKLYLSLSRYLKPSYKMIGAQIPSRYSKYSKEIESHKLLNNQSKNGALVSQTFLLDLETRLPYVSCKQHIYVPTSARKCVTEFNRIFNRPLKLAFLGDSTIRAYMQTLVKVYNDEFDFQFESSKHTFDKNENFLDDKAKHNIPLTGRGLQLRLYWAPFIDKMSNSSYPYFQGAMDVIQKWVNNGKDLDYPDILLISYGMWNIAHRSGFYSVNAQLLGLKAVSRLLKKLSTKTKVIFHITPPIKQWLLYKNSSNAIEFLDYVNQISFYELSNSQIWMWDSFYPVALKDIQECKNYLFLQKKFNVSTPREWNCHDYMHVGVKTKQISINLLWNLICNKIMSLGEDSCCT